MVQGCRVLISAFNVAAGFETFGLIEKELYEVAFYLSDRINRMDRIYRYSNKIILIIQ
jgi:hypothetical protein